MYLWRMLGAKRDRAILCEARGGESVEVPTEGSMTLGWADHEYEVDRIQRELKRGW